MLVCPVWLTTRCSDVPLTKSCTTSMASDLDMVDWNPDNAPVTLAKSGKSVIYAKEFPLKTLKLQIGIFQPALKHQEITYNLN